jgi:hypothetical protein
MKTKIIYKTLIKTIFALALFVTLFGCKKYVIPPDDTAYDLNVTLVGEGKSAYSSRGFIEFRQDPDTARIVDLNTSVNNLEPNHSYLLQRAVNPITDSSCSSIAWLTLGLGLQPQAIHTDAFGNGHADLWRAVTSVARGTQFHIHFQVLDSTTLSPVLSSDCYEYTVR